MKKYIIIFFTLILAILISLCSCQKDPSKCDHTYGSDGICTECGYETDYVFEITSDLGGYTLIAIGPAFKGGDVTIPSSYNGLPVVGVGDHAFANNLTSITSLTFPSSVKSIGYKAFANQKNLVSVNMKSGVSSIGAAAFYSCQSLRTVICGIELREILSDAFGKCANLSDVDLGAEVRIIGSSIFADCTSLESLTIPSSIQELGSDPFSGSGIKELYIGVSFASEDWDEDWAESLGDCNIHWGTTK